jgi:hypothetical protein
LDRFLVNPISEPMNSQLVRFLVFCSWGVDARFLQMLQNWVFPKVTMLSFFTILSSVEAIWNMRTVFITWIKIDFLLCLNIPNIWTCSGNLSGSSKAKFVTGYVILDKVSNVIVIDSALLCLVYVVRLDKLFDKYIDYKYLHYWFLRNSFIF